MTLHSINEKMSQDMLFRAALVLFLLTNTRAQLVCPKEQYLQTKPVSKHLTKNTITCPDATIDPDNKSGQIAGRSSLTTGDSASCSWFIGPFGQIDWRLTYWNPSTSQAEVRIYACRNDACTGGDTEILKTISYDGGRDNAPSTQTTYTTRKGYMRIEWYSLYGHSEQGFTGTWTVSPEKYPNCNNCPSNQEVENPYGGTTGISSCSCKPGWVTGPLGCDACTYGTYENSLGTCSNCPANSDSDRGSIVCTCNAGFQGGGTIENDFKRCTVCMAGKYRTLNEAVCEACPSGTFSNVNGSSTCQTCAVGSTSSMDRTKCETCADGTQAASGGKCDACPVGFYSNTETNRLCLPCPSGFYSTTNKTAICTACRACPDGYYRANCAYNKGGGQCTPCRHCGDGLVNVGCMNRAGNTDKSGTCRNRNYVVRTPLCDQKDSGLGLGGYTFLDLFGVSQDDASFQCRRRCDNEQNILSAEVYKHNDTYTELLRLFPNVNGIPQAFNGGQCGGPYACDVANCNIPGSSDDSQTDYQPKLACPVYIEPAMANAFWAAIESPNAGDASVISIVNAMRREKCQNCASCGQGIASVQDWGRGCARDCTQLSCQAGFIFDWTERDETAKCKPCGDLDDIRLCLSSEKSTFDSYDISGRLPKIYMKECSPKRQLPLRGYEIGYGSCVKCTDIVDACVAQRNTYYHTCDKGNNGIVPSCRSCSSSNGRTPTTSRYWDGKIYQLLYCQQPLCTVSAGLAYTGISTESIPHRICTTACKTIVCDSDASQVQLPCILPHQRRCKESVNMDIAVNDVEYRAVAYTPAHSNVLEPNTTEPDLFASFENVLVDYDAVTLSARAQCVWNADFIPDNTMNPAGISSRFASACRSWERDPRMQYPLLPLQNTVTQATADERVFPRRVLLNTTATAFAYAQGSVTRPAGVFAGDIYLELNLTKTNNATLAVFVPHDRAIEAATWVPRWRLSVYTKKVTGDNINLSITVPTLDTCFACFSIRIFPEASLNLTTVNMTTAIASFNGNKFFFMPSPGLMVCENSVQARGYNAFLDVRYGGNITVMFASSLTDACVSKFGINLQDLGAPADLIRSSGVLASGNCIVYMFSSTRIYCLRRSGGIVEISWQTPVQGTILDVTVHGGLLVRTLYTALYTISNDANYMSLISSIDGTSETVLQVPGLIMFARGAPRYFLRRTTITTLRLSKFETRNATFFLNESGSYQQDDVKIMFSQFVPVSAKNTLLEYADDFLVFATAKYSGSHVIVYVAALDTKLVLLNTYSMPFSVFFVTSSDTTQVGDVRYENVEFVGEALLSCTWLDKYILLISVSIEGETKSQLQPLQLNVTDLAKVSTSLHPDLKLTFDAPFVRVAGAVLSFGKLRSCSECVPASLTSSSGFFAYGVSLISYRRLIACDKANTFIEDDVVNSIPMKTCEKVRYDSGNVYSTSMQLTFRCVMSNPLEVILELPPNRVITFGKSITYTQPNQKRLLLSIPCEYGKPQFVWAFDNGDCETGCRYDLWDGGKLIIQGGITIQNVRHRPSLSLSSEKWDRRTLLQMDIPRASYPSTFVSGDWFEQSLVARSIQPLQQINFIAQRDVSAAWLSTYQDNEQRLALDTLAVMPVLSEHFMPVVAGNLSFLVSIVYVPTLSDLRTLALETLTYGDDILDWKRVHASVHISKVAPELRQCSYVARVVPVDTNMYLLTQASTVATGCIINLALSVQCHVELPERLTNDARVLGITIAPVTSSCRALSDADQVTVEFAPFMRVSQCPVFYFLDVSTLTCRACDSGKQACPAGKYVRGCFPLIHPSVTPECMNCTAPNNSFFESTSRGCASWTCLNGYYRQNGACAKCTALLTSVCRATGGLRRQNCTQLENEKCVDCAPKPRYSEWVVSTSECTWRCKTGFFETAGACEKCQTFDETVAYLAVSGARVQDAFYRFQTCSYNAQSRAERCVANDFGVSLDGAYVADGRVFGEDCPLRCADNSNRHSISMNLSRTGVAWTGQRCIDCPLSEWPMYLNSTRLPRYAFEMSSSCIATCVRTAGFYAHTNRSRTCLFCPSNICQAGFYFSSSNNCATCQPCTRSLAGGVFTASGAFDDSRSCPEKCPLGYFTPNAQTCQQHSVVSCRTGLQYAVPGTPTEDARCDTCADCSGAKEVAPCTLTSNRQCASCGPLDTWSSTWSQTGCNLICRAELGYTKLYNADGETCRKCLPCEVGYALPIYPKNCTCQPCATAIPAKAVYKRGCEWTCPLYHVARRDTSGVLVCEYTIRPTSGVERRVPSSSLLTCPAGQRLTQDLRPDAYDSLVCENCSTPAGMLTKDINVTWTWDRACDWQCAWGLDKQNKGGYFACETFRYIHNVKNQAAIVKPTKDQISPHIVGIIAGAVVFVVFGMCFMCRMLQG